LNDSKKRQFSAAFCFLPVKEKFSLRHKDLNPYFCDPEQVLFGRCRGSSAG
jgi:hypothetical protein